jgi:hypothetical protein
MSTTFDFINSDALRTRVFAVQEALTDQQRITVEDVRDVFIESCGDPVAGQDSWTRLTEMTTPTAAELALYAEVLQVNTTWLITGDVRFINADLLAKSCLCFDVPEEYHFVFYGVTEPGSALEYNPDCLVHGPGGGTFRPARLGVAQAAQTTVPAEGGAF